MAAPARSVTSTPTSSPNSLKLDIFEDWGALGFGAYPVLEVANLMVPMRDGVKLAVKLWLPMDKLTETDIRSPHQRLIYGGSEGHKDRETFGTILEYIPYCKDYTTLERDHARHTWWTSHGFVACHADLRGTGASEGVYFDEYTKQEFQDGADIIEWLANQSWSNGRVGLYGKSWGGFNGLQIAYEQPPALKTAISLYSTDDRYTDDVHYMGGCVVGTGMVSWANTMFWLNSRAPPVQYMTDLSSWRGAWRKRLNEAGKSWLPIWLSHQVRTDPYWAQGSVNEDITRIKIPILAIGGLADGYTNAPLRMADTLNKESKILIGPWSHGWPDVTIPGPRIDFCTMCLGWWNAHLTADEDEPSSDRDAVNAWPRVRLFVRDPHEPAQHVDVVPGRWINLPCWSKRSQDYRSIVEAETDGEDGDDTDDTAFVQTYYFGKDRIMLEEPLEGAGETLRLEPHKFQGINCGNWLAMGNGVDLPEDQTVANLHSLSFTTPQLEEDLNLSGFATAILALRAEKAGRYCVAVRLSHLHASGKALRITYGFLNLAQWEGNRNPKKMFPGGKTMRVRIELSVACFRVPKGDRLVVSISPSYAPTMYPPTHLHGLTLDTADSSLVLQVLPTASFKNNSVFVPPRPLLKLDCLQMEESAKENTYNENPDGSVTFKLIEDHGSKFFPHLGLTMKSREEDIVEISADLSKTRTIGTRTSTYTYEKPKVSWSVVACSEMRTDGDSPFYLRETLDAKIDGQPFWDKAWEATVPREWV